MGFETPDGISFSAKFGCCKEFNTPRLGERQDRYLRVTTMVTPMAP